MVAELERIDFHNMGGFRTSFVSERGGLWHFHPEYELVLNLKSFGTRIIGDNVELFDPYTMTFIAGNLPHSWNHSHIDGNVPADHGIVCNFRSEAIGDSFLSQHEMRALRDLLSDAERGVAFSESDARKAEPFLRNMTTQTGIDKMVSFFAVMAILCSAEKKRILCSDDYKRTNDQRGNKRMSDVYTYIRLNYAKPLSLKKISAVANMSPFAFSRFFKKNSGVSLVEYVNQVRINRVCYLLRETDNHIHEIASECGFKSISNFNKYFRKRTSFAPREYRSGYRINE
jgi:AraC-like DNA-binding protein